MVNHVILLGNLGKDPELRYTPSGVAVCTFTLATSEKFKDRDGKQQEKTEWHNIVIWRQLAEIAGKYLQKGKTVYLEGKIQSRSYDDRDGVKKYITEIVAERMRMVGGRTEGGPSRENRSQGTGRSESTGGGGYDEPPFNPDDDLPFFHPYDMMEESLR